MLRVNLFGALFVMQEAVPLMLAQGGGCIVNVASLAGGAASRRSAATAPPSSR